MVDPVHRSNATAAANRSSRADRMYQHIDEIEDFISGLEKIGLSPPPHVKKAIEALKVGTDVAKSAEEVAEWLARASEDLHAACEESARRTYGVGWEADDQAYVCKANVDRFWQQRSASAVLYWHDDRSGVRKFWEKFKGRIAEWIAD